MTTDNNGGDGKETTKTKTRKPKISSNRAETTVAITTKKKGGGKEKEELIKIVMRRLPSEMDKDELWEQLQPLPVEPIAFWFCAADSEFRPVAAFSRAYIVFREEENAIAFAERFNGYVFVDKQGNESMAIVECAPNQHVPKDLSRPAKESDMRSGTLENEPQYRQFLESYEQQLAASTRRVTNFDDLVRELEEKQRRLEEGQVQETPLTAYMSRHFSEKGRKKQQKLLERLEKRQVRTVDWAEVYQKRNDGEVAATMTTPVADGEGSGTSGREKREQRKLEGRREKRQQREQRKGEWTPPPSGAAAAVDGGQSASDRKKKEKTPPAQATAGGDAIKKSRRRENGGGKRENGGNSGDLAKDKNGQSSTSRAEVGGEEAKREGSAGTENNSARPRENAPSENAKPAKRNTAAAKNRDRPEREIYRPGKTRLRPSKTNEVKNGGGGAENVAIAPQEEQK